MNYAGNSKSIHLLDSNERMINMAKLCSDMDPFTLHFKIVMTSFGFNLSYY